MQVKLSEFVGLRFLLLYSGWDGFSFLCTLGDCCIEVAAAKRATMWLANIKVSLDGHDIREFKYF